MSIEEERLYFKEYEKYLNRSEALILGQMASTVGMPVAYGLGLFKSSPLDESLPEYRE